MADELKIEDGVPIPPNGRNAGPVRLALEAMKVGQSMFVPRCLCAPGSAQAIASNVGRDLGRAFTTRKEGDGRRIWRIK